jgi:hypothetical protein
MTTAVKDFLEAQRLLVRQLRRSTELLDGVFDLLNEMNDEETRAIVDTSFVEELMKASEHLRGAEEALLRGVHDA